jgi:hypothetical protein
MLFIAISSKSILTEGGGRKKRKREAESLMSKMKSYRTFKM